MCACWSPGLSRLKPGLQLGEAEGRRVPLPGNIPSELLRRVTVCHPSGNATRPSLFPP